MRHSLCRLACFCLVFGLVAAPSDAAEFFLRPNERVVFLGDSITNAGKYIAYLDGYLFTRFPEETFQLLNLGLSSETASGLSEADHPFPRPTVHERLERALELTRPHVVVAGYGMNDGIYAPFDSARFDVYIRGIEKLVAAVEKRGARLVLLTPPPFDPRAFEDRALPLGATQYGYRAPYRDYDDVLARYGGWLLEQASPRFLVVDLHGPLSRFMAAVQKQDPAYRVSPDGIHPDATGHWLIARALLEAWHAPREVDRVEIDARTSKVPAGRVLSILLDSSSIRFTWITRIPMPFDPAWDHRLQEQGVSARDFNRHVVKITNLTGGKYGLYEDERRMGEVDAGQLARGIDLIAFPDLSTNRRSAKLGKLVERRDRLVAAAWLARVGHKRPNTPSGPPFDEALEQAAQLDSEIRSLARPAEITLRLEVVPKK